MLQMAGSDRKEARMRKQFLTACNRNDTRTILDIINEVSGSSRLLSKLLNQVNAVVGSPLHVAARHGHLETLKILVQYNVDINHTYQDADGHTNSALLCALQHGHKPVVKFLVELGANAHGTDDGVARWLEHHPQEKRWVHSLSEDPVKVHAVEQFLKKLSAGRDLQLLEDEIAAAESDARAAANAAQHAVEAAEKAAALAQQAEDRKQQLQAEFAARHTEYEEGRINAEHAEQALRAWSTAMDAVQPDTADFHGLTSEDVVAVAHSESMTIPMCTPLEVSATCHAGQGMELLWYKDGLPFVVPSSNHGRNDAKGNNDDTDTTYAAAAGRPIQTHELSNEQFIADTLQQLNPSSDQTAPQVRSSDVDRLRQSDAAPGDTEAPDFGDHDADSPFPTDLAEDELENEPYPVLAPPTIHNTVLEITAGFSADIDNVGGDNNRHNAQIRMLDELEEEDETFILASNYLKQWLGSRAFFDIAKGDFMLPDLPSHSRTATGASGFDFGEAPGDADRTSVHSMMPKSQSLLCRVVAQAFLEHALKFVPISTCEAPNLSGDLDEDLAQAHAEVFETDFPEVASKPKSRHRWKITLHAMALDGVENADSAEAREEREAREAHQNTQGSGGLGEVVEVFGRTRPTDLRVFVSRSTAQFRLQSDATDDAVESDDRAPAASKMVMTTPPRIRSTLYVPSARISDGGTYVCHLAKRTKVPVGSLPHTADAATVGDIPGWQIVRRRLCEVEVTLLNWEDSLDQLEQRLAGAVRRCQRAEELAQEAFAKHHSQTRIHSSYMQQLNEVLQTLRASEDTVMRITADLRGALQIACEEGMVVLSSISGDTKDSKDSSQRRATPPGAATNGAISSTGLNVDPQRTHNAVNRVALLWDDISQRVATWTQPSTEFYQALYSLKAAKTVSLVRQRDVAFSQTRLKVTEVKLRRALSSRLRRWSAKCVIEDNRNMVVKLEATAREDFGHIFAELSTALQAAEAGSSDDFALNDDLLYSGAVDGDRPDGGDAQHKILRAQYVASITRAIVKIVRKLTEPPVCDSDLIQHRGLTILCQVLAQWNPPARPAHGSEVGADDRQKYDSLYAMLRAVSNSVSVDATAGHHGMSVHDVSQSKISVAAPQRTHAAKALIDLALAALRRFGRCASHVAIPSFALLSMLGYPHEVLSILEAGTAADPACDGPLSYASRVFTGTSEFLGLRGDLLRLVGMLRTYKLQVVGSSAISTVWHLVSTQWFAASLLWEDRQLDGKRCILNAKLKFEHSQRSSTRSQSNTPTALNGSDPVDQQNPSEDASVNWTGQNCPAIVCTQVARICKAIIDLKSAATQLDAHSIVDILDRFRLVPSVCILACRLLLQRTFRIQTQRLFLTESESLVRHVLATVSQTQDSALRRLRLSDIEVETRQGLLRIVEECRRAHSVWSLAALLIYLQLDQPFPSRDASGGDGASTSQTWLDLWDRLHARGVSSPTILRGVRVCEMMFWGLPHTDAAVLLYYARHFHVGSDGLPLVEETHHKHHLAQIAALRQAREANAASTASAAAASGRDTWDDETFGIAQAAAEHELQDNEEKPSAAPESGSPAGLETSPELFVASDATTTLDMEETDAPPPYSDEEETQPAHTKQSTTTTTDDNVSENVGDLNAARAAEESQEPTVGDRVEARYGGGDIFYPGTVRAVHPAHSDAAPDSESLAQAYNIVYDDGDRELGVEPSLIRLVSPQPAVDRLEVGAKVFALYAAAAGNVKWFPAVITAVETAAEGDKEGTTQTMTYRTDPAYKKYFKLLEVSFSRIHGCCAHAES